MYRKCWRGGLRSLDDHNQGKCLVRDSRDQLNSASLVPIPLFAKDRAAAEVQWRRMLKFEECDDGVLNRSLLNGERNGQQKGAGNDS